MEAPAPGSPNHAAIPNANAPLHSGVRGDGGGGGRAPRGMRRRRYLELGGPALQTEADYACFVALFFLAVIIPACLYYLVRCQRERQVGGDDGEGRQGPAEDEADAERRREAQIMNDRRLAERLQRLAERLQGAGGGAEQVFDHVRVQRRLKRRGRLLDAMESFTMVVKAEDLVDATDVESGDDSCLNGSFSSLDSNQQTLVLPPIVATTEEGTSSYAVARQQQRQVESCCSICLTTYEAGDGVVWSSNPDCPHVYHRDCMLDWLQKGKKRCPCCRNVFILDNNKEEGESEASSSSSPGAAVPVGGGDDVAAESSNDLPRPLSPSSSSPPTTSPSISAPVRMDEEIAAPVPPEVPEERQGVEHPPRGGVGQGGSSDAPPTDAPAARVAPADEVMGPRGAAAARVDLEQCDQ